MNDLAAKDQSQGFLISKETGRTYLCFDLREKRVIWTKIFNAKLKIKSVKYGKNLTMVTRAC